MKLRLPGLLLAFTFAAVPAANAAGGSCSGNAYPSKMCFDYSRDKTTTVACNPGFRYSPGGCDTAGASGACSMGPVDIYYWHDAAMAKEVCAMQGGRWNGNAAAAAAAARGAAAGTPEGTARGAGTGEAEAAAKAGAEGPGTRPATPPGGNPASRSSGAPQGTAGNGAARAGGGNGGGSGGGKPVDEDSCWDASRCKVVVVKTRWRKDNFLVIYQNTCPDRVYASFCNEQVGGRWSCGADGIRTGRTHAWDTYDATGKYKIDWVGVRKAQDDWVCAGKARKGNAQ